jgi:HAMP domain-containing protein
MVFGRYFDPETRATLSRVTRLDLAFAAEGEPSFTGDLAMALPRLASPEATLIEAANESDLVGYTRFVDVTGRRSLVARAVMPREIDRQARLTLRYVLVALILVGLIFAAVMMILIERAVLGRLARLSAQVGHVTEGFDFSARVEGATRDEIGRLGDAINSLLAAAEQVSYAGSETEAKYAALQAHLPVALACLDVVLDENGRTKDLVFRETTDAFAAATGLRNHALGRTLDDALGLPDESRAAWLAATERARNLPGPQSFALRVGAKGVRVTVAAISENRVMVHLRTSLVEEKNGGGAEATRG